MRYEHHPITESVFFVALCLMNSTNELHGCARDVVAEQCGDKVAAVLSGLVDIVVATAGCNNAPRLRSLLQPHKYNRGN